MTICLLIESSRLVTSVAVISTVLPVELQIIICYSIVSIQVWTNFKASNNLAKLFFQLKNNNIFVWKKCINTATFFRLKDFRLLVPYNLGQESKISLRILQLSLIEENIWITSIKIFGISGNSNSPTAMCPLLIRKVTSYQKRAQQITNTKPQFYDTIKQSLAS